MMRIAIGLPANVPRASGASVLEWARRAEAGPFSSVAVLDRVVSPALEPLVTLAAVAGTTRRVRLITSVLIAPTRETTLLSRQAASLDALSGGRLTLGVGIGVREDDYLAAGGEFGRLGRRLDEQLPVLRRLWRGERLSDAVGSVGPAPARPGGPELLIGGYVPAVVRRIALWGDGFLSPGGATLEANHDLWQRAQQGWSAAGREGMPRWVAGSYFALGPQAPDHAAAYIQAMYGHDPALAERRLRGIPITPAAVEDLIGRHAEAGADELILRPCAAALDQLERLAEVVAGTGGDVG